MAEELEVFGFWPSPFSLRVELALKLKGIQYKYLEEDVLNNKSDLLAKHNSIYKNIYVLLHHGKPILEYLVILEHIEEAWKHSHILPQHPHQRALARFWATFIYGKVQ
ncbi:glutathione S-transferase U8-like [Benincasa hispida]|uniref:glutathione S-transferase U8-like n=1 Tax=Benincasa hispida TaxID=102211 RepID=UPI0019009D21|nr:glutathione S-transferase U8-like [Benincasa hispida]